MRMLSVYALYIQLVYDYSVLTITRTYLSLRRQHNIVPSRIFALERGYISSSGTPSNISVVQS